MKGMRTPLFLLAVFLLASPPSGAAMFDFYLPWNDASPSATDLSYLNSVPAGASGFVTAGTDGHLYVGGQRIRFWGSNTVFTSNFPSAAQAPLVAGRMAKYGFNCVRFHHMDMAPAPDGIWNMTWDANSLDRTLSATQMTKLDDFIHELAQRGIYSNLNLMVSRPLKYASGATDIDSAITLIGDWKVRHAVGFFDPKVRQLQKQFATDLLTHVNHNTGVAYKDDPAIAFIEINNENGLVQAYLSDQVDGMPAFYRDELGGLWNTWLQARYGAHAALSTAWGAFSQPPGPEMLPNGDFASGTLANWFWNNGYNLGTAVVSAGTGPGGMNACQMAVTATDPTGWHLQLIHGGVSVSTANAYTLSFQARAAAPRTVSVSVGRNDTTYESVGLYRSVSLTTSWQSFSFTFVPNQTYANCRVTFENFCQQLGSWELADVSLATGGTVGFYPGENLDTGTIRPFLHNGETTPRTAAASRDWFRFLLETEEDYWLDLYDHIRSVIGAKQLIFGTIIGCSTPNVQAKLDVVDTHTYWQHPSFPGAAWDNNNWYLGNQAMVNDQVNSTVAGYSVKRVHGKPHAVTEYNHASPNSYESEAAFFMAAYSAFQDHDALFLFDYNGWTSTFDQRMIDSFFSINSNPAKMASSVPAALAFRRGDVSPGAQLVADVITAEEESQYLLTSWAWRLVDLTSAGADPRESLLHRTAIVTGNGTMPPGAQSPAGAVAGNVFAADTGQIVWDESVVNQGWVRVDSPASKWAWGFIGGRTIPLSGGVTFQPGTGVLGAFSCLALSALDTQDVSTASRLLLTVLGAQRNTGDAYFTWNSGTYTATSFPPPFNANISHANGTAVYWGSLPSQVEAVPATVTLPQVFGSVEVYALDSRGARALTLSVSNAAGRTRFTTGAPAQSLWYEVAPSGPTATPTVTATPTRTWTITSTPTPSSTRTSTATPSASPTATPSETPSFTSTDTATATRTPSPTETRTPTITPTATETPTGVWFTDTFTPTFTPTFTTTHTLTSTPTPTFTITSTRTFTWTETSTPSHSPSATYTPTLVPSPTPSPSSTPVMTLTPNSSLLIPHFPLLGPYVDPNPTDGSVLPALVLPEGTTGTVTVRIFTTALRKISEKRFDAVSLPALPLPSTDGNGRLLANGVYFVVVDTARGRDVAKWLILR